MVNGVELRFRLAGINNQNFLMRDEQTGTFWQQITGLAVSGPLAGHRLTLVSADELTFALWKSEQPQGSVLKDVPAYASQYSPANWDVRMARVPTVLSYAQPGLTPREIMLGIQAFGGTRAFRYKTVLQEQLIQDHVGSEPVLLVVGPDNRSVRVFRRRLRAGETETPQFYRLTGSSYTDPPLLDSGTGSRWNFKGCAVQGKLKGICLEPIYVIKDYWFDWRHYHPDTTVYADARISGAAHPGQPRKTQ